MQGEWKQNNTLEQICKPTAAGGKGIENKQKKERERKKKERKTGRKEERKGGREEGRKTLHLKGQLYPLGPVLLLENG